MKRAEWYLEMVTRERRLREDAGSPAPIQTYWLDELVQFYIRRIGRE